jgi:hypothetical protein
MDGAHEPTNEGWMLPTERGRHRWVRVGFISAALWALVGLGLASLRAQTGPPRESGFVVLLFEGPRWLCIQPPAFTHSMRTGC